VNRAFSNVTIRAVSEDRREIEGWASTPATDRQSDQVMPEGAVFELPLPFLLDHDHHQVVGEVYRAEVSAQGIRFWARIQKIAEPGAARDLVDYAWSLIKNGLRKVVSVGFRPLGFEPLPGGGLRFTSWEWIELSAVGIAAQPAARITGTKAAGRANTGARRALVSPPGHISVAEHEKRVRQHEALKYQGLIPPRELNAPPGHISVAEHERLRVRCNAALVKSGLAPRPGRVVRAPRACRVVRLDK
jgi:hypothetical protein